MSDAVLDNGSSATGPVIDPAESRSLVATFPSGVMVTTLSEPNRAPLGATSTRNVACPLRELRPRSCRGPAPRGMGHTHAWRLESRKPRTCR
jgi:hypothetical protein